MSGTFLDTYKENKEARKQLKLTKEEALINAKETLITNKSEYEKAKKDYAINITDEYKTVFEAKKTELENTEKIIKTLEEELEMCNKHFYFDYDKEKILTEFNEYVESKKVDDLITTFESKFNQMITAAVNIENAIADIQDKGIEFAYAIRHLYDSVENRKELHRAIEGELIKVNYKVMEQGVSKYAEMDSKGRIKAYNVLPPVQQLYPDKGNNEII